MTSLEPWCYACDDALDMCECYEREARKDPRNAYYLTHCEDPRPNRPEDVAALAPPTNGSQST